MRLKEKAMLNGLDYFLISAENYRMEKGENEYRTRKLEQRLMDSGLKFKKAIGKYKGETEQCFIVEWRTGYYTKFIFDLAREFEQRAVISVVGSFGTLFEGDHLLPVKTGKINLISKEKALQVEGYTLVNDQYFYIEWSA